MIPLSVLLQGQVLVVLSLCLLHFPVCAYVGCCTAYLSCQSGQSTELKPRHGL